MSDNTKQFSSNKILKHLDRVNKWVDGGNPAPITVEIDMTNVCNHACPECVAGRMLKDDSTLDRELAERIISELAASGVRGLIFTGGGEPLCHRDTPEMVSYAASLGMDVGLITNGQLLTEEISRVILEHCVWVRVSLDAATAGTFSAVHGVHPDYFEAILDAIRNLTNMKRQLFSSTTVGAGFLTSRDTVSEMEAAAILCRSLGVDYLQYRPMQIHRMGHFDYQWADVGNCLKRCFEYSTPDFNVLYSRHKYEMMREKNYGRYYGKCFGHQFATVISATGKMYVCCHLRGNEKYEIGDLSQQSFQDIWNSERRRAVSENIDFEDCIPLCRDNTFNQILWEIRCPVDHCNFL
jgi:radical SAM protein with 4Fe4S-binding SPASM domain